MNQCWTMWSNRICKPSQISHTKQEYKRRVLLSVGHMLCPSPQNTRCIMPRVEDTAHVLWISSRSSHMWTGVPLKGGKERHCNNLVSIHSVTICNFHHSWLCKCNDLMQLFLPEWASPVEGSCLDPRGNQHISCTHKQTFRWWQIKKLNVFLPPY